MTKKKKVILLAVLSLPVACVICLTAFSLDNWAQNRFPEAKRIRSMGEPDLVVWWFHQALLEDNITFAKELVSAENREWLNTWQKETQRRNYACEFDWGWFLKYPFDIQNLSWGSISSVEIDENTIEYTSHIGCYNNDYSMKIDKIVVEHKEKEWVITGWHGICENRPSDTPDRSTEVCYP